MFCFIILLGSVWCRQYNDNLSCCFRIQDFDELRIETSEVLSRYYTHPVFSLSVNFWGRIRVPVQCDENLNSFVLIGVSISSAIWTFLVPLLLIQNPRYSFLKGPFPRNIYQNWKNMHIYTIQQQDSTQQVVWLSSFLRCRAVLLLLQEKDTPSS